MRIGFLLLMLVPASLWAETPDKPRDPSANGTLQFWKAVAFYPTLSTEEEKVVEEWSNVPLDGPAEKILSQSQNALLFFKRAAEAPYCDWGLDYNDGIELLLPHLAKARQLARLTALHARQAFARGDSTSALADIHAITLMARYVSQDPILISKLVGIAMERLAFELIANHATKISTPVTTLQSQYQSLPPAATLRQSLLIEGKYFTPSLIRILDQAERAKAGSWKEKWREMLGASDTSEINKVASLKEAKKLIESISPLYKELDQYLALPPNEFDEKYPEFMTQVKTRFPVGAMFLPTINRGVHSEREYLVRQQMLFAGLAVAQGGIDQLKNFKDPFGTGPFEYKKLAEGFELQSQFKTLKNEPVRMTFK